MLELTITKPDGTAFFADIDAEAPKRQSDPQRYSTFNFTGSFEIPVDLYDWIKLKEDGNVLFRGYVYYRKKQGQKITINCRGEEELLMHRFSPRHGWQMAGGPTQDMNTIYLTHIYEDGAPSQVLDPLGVIHNSGGIFLANSNIPQTKWTYVSGWIWKLAGGGTSSRIGTAALYIEGLLLPRQSTYAAMAATTNSAYADATDLWINLDSSTYVAAWLLHISALNAFDSHVRRGTIDKSSTAMTGNLQLNVNRWADILINTAIFYGLSPHWRYTDLYTYFDALDES